MDEPVEIESKLGSVIDGDVDVGSDELVFRQVD